MSYQLEAALLAVLFVILFPAQTPSQSPVTAETPYGIADPFPYIHDFVEVFYPEIFNKGLLLSISSTQIPEITWRQISGASFRVTKSTPLFENPIFDRDGRPDMSGAENPTYVGGSFWFERDGRIREFEVSSCKGVSFEKNEALRTIVESHKEWTPAEPLQALKEAQPRYGPEDQEAFVASLPREKLNIFS